MYLAKLMERFWWRCLVLVSEEENNQRLFPERAEVVIPGLPSRAVVLLREAGGRVGVRGYASPLPSPSGWLSSLRHDGPFYLDPWGGRGEVPLTT